MDVTPTDRTAPTRERYLAYMNSADWRVCRDSKLREVGWRCERCAAKRNLQVHHTSYEHFGHEFSNELKVLCADCNRADHLERPDQTSLGLYLKLASEAIRDDPWATIADLSETIKRRCVEVRVPILPERIKSAIAVVSGRLKSDPRSQAESRPDLDRRYGGPLTEAEARDFFFRQDIGNMLKTMPPSHVPLESQQRHEEKLRQQCAAMRRAPRRPSVMDRLKEIFESKEF